MIEGGREIERERERLRERERGESEKRQRLRKKENRRNIICKTFSNFGKYCFVNPLVSVWKYTFKKTIFVLAGNWKLVESR